MKCSGCGEELDGLLAHAMHVCSAPSKDPVQQQEYVFAPMGKAMYQAMQECMKELVEHGIQHQRKESSS